MHQQTVTTLMTSTMSHPSLPASPTLTNPDMILPYGEYDSTPSPPHNPDRSSGPLGGWKGDDMNFSIGPPSQMQMGMGPMTPTTPIIYGNGTMLSDIGEVTEAESTPGRKPRLQNSRTKALSSDSPVGSSPTMGYNAPMKRSKNGNHHRTMSAESNSTVTTEGHTVEYFEDFDDGISVDDSNFQGDDEESVVDEGYEHREAVQAKVIMRKEGRLIGGDDQSQSSAALSRRAEMILANAKKRLDNMEGNLTRARSSLYITPSSSMSSIHSSSPLSRSTPSPPVADHRIIAGLGVPPARHRQVNQFKSPGSSGHSRVLSENSIPTSPFGGSPHHQNDPRSISVPVPDMEDTPVYSVALSRSFSTHYHGPLDPLSEDGNTSPRIESARSSTADPYSQPTTDHRVLGRSASSMQMRGLTDKMKDLKGKISTLRDRAREDTMKRRSLQSLRTPSPFTAAEQWYSTSSEYTQAGILADALTMHNPLDGEISVEGSAVDGHEEKNEVKFAESEEPSVYEDVDEARGQDEDHVAISSVDENDEIYDTAGSDLESEGGEEDGGEDDNEYADELVEADDYESEGDGSLYHDSLTTPMSHEDREDAFDYEHFFLHSAMGSLLHNRNRSGSFSSNDSVETTRGLERPSTVSDDRTAQGHLRGQKSTDSISTLATFATARERSSEDLGSREEIIEEAEEAEMEEEEDVDERPEAPLTAKRSTFGTPNKLPLDRDPTTETINDSRPVSVIHDPKTTRRIANGATDLHRPSVSSFASTGSTRSFPLVNKPKTNAGSILSARSIDNISLYGEGDGASPVQMLVRDDQILVERLVASLGKCVLGLQEAVRGSAEGRMWRRRMETARRVLEGMEGVA